MKIVVIGGTGLIGTKVVKRLTEKGHQALTASPNTGVKSTNDPREVVPDAQADYFGVRLDDRSLVPGEGAHLGTIRLEDWLRQPKAR